MHRDEVSLKCRAPFRVERCGQRFCRTIASHKYVPYRLAARHAEYRGARFKGQIECIAKQFPNAAFPAPREGDQPTAPYPERDPAECGMPLPHLRAATHISSIRRDRPHLVRSFGQTDTPIGVCPCPSEKGQADIPGRRPLLSAVRALLSHCHAPARPDRPSRRSAWRFADRPLPAGKPDPGPPSFQPTTTLRARMRCATPPE